MFAEAALEMQIQNQNQGMIDDGQRRQDDLQDPYLEDYPLFGYDENGMPNLPYVACQTLQDMIMQSDFMVDQDAMEGQQDYYNQEVMDFDAEMHDFDSKDNG